MSERLTDAELDAERSQVGEITRLLQEKWINAPPEAAPLTIVQLLTVADILAPGWAAAIRQVRAERDRLVAQVATLRELLIQTNGWLEYGSLHSAIRAALIATEAPHDRLG